MVANQGVIATDGAAVEVSAVLPPRCHGSLVQQLIVQEAAPHRVIGAEAVVLAAQTGAVLAGVAILAVAEPEAVGNHYGTPVCSIYR